MWLQNNLAHQIFVNLYRYIPSVVLSSEYSSTNTTKSIRHDCDYEFPSVNGVCVCMFVANVDRYPLNYSNKSSSSDTKHILYTHSQPLFLTFVCDCSAWQSTRFSAVIFNNSFTLSYFIFSWQCHIMMDSNRYSWRLFFFFWVTNFELSCAKTYTHFRMLLNLTFNCHFLGIFNFEPHYLVEKSIEVTPYKMIKLHGHILWGFKF